MYLRSEPSIDIYFHVFNDMESYQQWPLKNKITLLYLDEVLLPNLNPIIGSSAAGLGVVQAKNGMLRSTLKYRYMLYASNKCFEASKAFNEPSQFEEKFIKSSILSVNFFGSL